MSFKGKHRVCSKIGIDGSILEQMKNFNYEYFGCELSLDGEPDFDNKINRFQNICRTIRQRLKKHREIQMKFNKALARPILLYGSKTWVIVG
jgi:hypothetical protein